MPVRKSVVLFAVLFIVIAGWDEANRYFGTDCQYHRLWDCVCAYYAEFQLATAWTFVCECFAHLHFTKRELVVIVAGNVLSWAAMHVWRRHKKFYDKQTQPVPATVNSPASRPSSAHQGVPATVNSPESRPSSAHQGVPATVNVSTPTTRGLHNAAPGADNAPTSRFAHVTHENEVHRTTSNLFPPWVSVRRV